MRIRELYKVEELDMLFVSGFVGVSEILWASCVDHELLFFGIQGRGDGGQWQPEVLLLSQQRRLSSVLWAYYSLQLAASQGEMERGSSGGSYAGHIESYPVFWGVSVPSSEFQVRDVTHQEVSHLSSFRPCCSHPYWKKPEPQDGWLEAHPGAGPGVV